MAPMIRLMVRDADPDVLSRTIMAARKNECPATTGQLADLNTNIPGFADVAGESKTVPMEARPLQGGADAFALVTRPAEPRPNTRDIARHLGNQHKAVMALVER